jgi:hypothetical protein
MQSNFLLFLFLIFSRYFSSQAGELDQASSACPSLPWYNCTGDDCYVDPVPSLKAFLSNTTLHEQWVAHHRYKSRIGSGKLHTLYIQGAPCHGLLSNWTLHLRKESTDWPVFGAVILYEE